MIENELKYVLNLDTPEDIFIEKTNKIYEIEQGYLNRSRNLTVRLRRQNDGEEVKYVLTVKHKTSPGRFVEVEKKISMEDFLEMSTAADGWLFKTRYVIKGWDVDFFKREGETYFVMAEIEMPDGQSSPKKIPKFISENLLYAVGRDDCRFSSRKLSEVGYAASVLAEISRAKGV